MSKIYIRMRGKDMDKSSNGLIVKIKSKRKGVMKSKVFMPTEILKAEGLSKPQGTSNAPNTVTGGPGKAGSGGKLGAGAPESSKKKVDKRVPGRKTVSPPSKPGRNKVSGEESNAANNILKLTNVKTGKVRSLKLGTIHKAKFDMVGNLISVQMDSKSYPVQNHLVRLPKGVYQYSGMVSVAAKVVGA